MFFTIKAGIYFWVVFGITKAVTTCLSLYNPAAINRWYDFNNQLIQSVPVYGQQLRALVRDNVADGTIAFWEVWFALGLFLSVCRWSTRGFRKTKQSRRT